MKFLGFMWNPLSWVMEVAAIMANALANGGVSCILLIVYSVENVYFDIYVNVHNRIMTFRNGCTRFF